MSEMYSPRDAQKMLKINSSTLRKYANILEKHGYHIHRNTRGHRGFFDQDVNILRQLIEFSKQEDMTLEHSVEAAMASVSEQKKSDTVSGPVEITNDLEDPNELLVMSEEEIARSSEENRAESQTESVQKTDERDIELARNHYELLERIEHLERINLDLIKLLKEKAVREAYLEEKINQIARFVDRSEQLMVERSKLMEEEVRLQIAAAQQKKWWQWWK
ncbi:MerR family transcriptional regulator [Bacillus salipaludis]|uniref:MerR family transcriptional regulator n=1 Tax=Bacillus salipaludis TaxID=2547811 RepID=A0A4R5VPE3_9BACI|nr:MerR family transcriptional regulator [Bacillus salipaludis]MDQ6598245.1 MerR family transcriptional regulator [Bacillus salipaludis]TDK59379.1 MerR family transcriptional regulator [Bacillus salipaludis]